MITRITDYRITDYRPA
jgi:hypothetical protein